MKNKQLETWEMRKADRQAEEKEQAVKELEHWELRLRKARTENDKALAEKRIEYWRMLI